MKKIVRLTESDLNKIVRRVIKESTSEVDVRELLKKINGILVSALENEVTNLSQSVSVKFGFDGQRTFKMYDDLGDILFFDDYSSDWNGKTTNYMTPITYIKEINSSDFISDVESELSEEELTAFNQIGFVASTPNKSLKELMSSGKIFLWLKPMGSNNIMTWERIQTSGGSLGAENTACAGLTSYKDLGEEIKSSDIFFIGNEDITKSKKICNGGTKISNGGLGLGLHKPINDIINSNK